MLLEIKAVHFYDEKPFFFTSGWASPVYIDCRKIISYPRLRSSLIDFAAATIVRDIGYESIDSVAGGETAGIPFAAWISDRLMLPMQYVRKKAKGFGRNAQIEGEVAAGARTLLVEDLATDGRSKINFCQALRNAGANVDHCFVLFYYDIFPKSREPEPEQRSNSDLGGRLHKNNDGIENNGGSQQYISAMDDRSTIGGAAHSLQLSKHSCRKNDVTDLEKRLNGGANRHLRQSCHHRETRGCV